MGDCFLDVDKGSNSNIMCSKPDQQQQHPQQLKSPRTISNWYAGRRPRTAFTNSQVINQSVNIHAHACSKLTLKLTSLILLMCVCLGPCTGDSVLGELLPRYSAEGAAGRET